MLFASGVGSSLTFSIWWVSCVAVHESSFGASIFGIRGADDSDDVLALLQTRAVLVSDESAVLAAVALNDWKQPAVIAPVHAPADGVGEAVPPAKGKLEATLEERAGPQASDVSLAGVRSAKESVRKAQHGRKIGKKDAKDDPGIERRDSTPADKKPARTMKHRGGYYRETLGIEDNGSGDLGAFLAALGCNVVTVVICMLIFSKLRVTFPIMYATNTLTKPPTTTFQDDEEEHGFTGWWKATMRMDTAELAHAAGLDHAMLLEFCSLAMRIMLIIGVPHLLILAPLHAFWGPNASGSDHLSRIGFANVEEGSSVCWIDGLFVWGVVAATQWCIFEAQRGFMEHRIAWLKRMPFPRVSTVLVENIPHEHCSDSKLRDYFDGVFGGKVVMAAYMVLRAPHALALQTRVHTLDAKLAVAEDQLQKSKTEGVELRPTFRVADPRSKNFGVVVDAIEEWTAERGEKQAELDAEGQRISDVVASGELDGGLCSTSGFVIFEKRQTSAHVLKHNVTEDLDSFSVSLPPEPSDVIWEDLKLDTRVQAGMNLVGYAAAVGLFFGFLPLVIAVSSITSLENLRDHVPFFDYIILKFPTVAEVWNGTVGAALLSTLMGFVPTFLVLIFDKCFVLRAKAWLQLKVQEWYFYFLVIFVLLVTAIGSSLFATLREVGQDPESLLRILAATMPKSTHFYLNFVLAQWTTHAMVLMRHSLLIKFLGWEKLIGTERAKAKAEPEDQGYFGIGSRSARFSLMLVTCLVFCTLSPLICALGFVNFFLCRGFYGYLFVFAETVKPDLGGLFWCRQLKHVQQGLFIYVFLMVAVLKQRAASSGPMWIAALSLLLLVPSYLRFDRAFQWEHLSLAAIKGSEDSGHGDPVGSYVQPELAGVCKSRAGAR